MTSHFIGIVLVCCCRPCFEQENGIESKQCRSIKRADTMPMEFFIESRNLDQVTAQILKSYDKSNDGHFSKEEVISIVLDLKQQCSVHDDLVKYNKLYKRVLCLAILFAVFILNATLLLSLVVANLTIKMDVVEDGTMVVAGSSDNQAVSTDSRADIHDLVQNEYGVMCTTLDEALLMKLEVEVGRNVVILSTDTATDAQQLTQISGRGTEWYSNGDFCFIPPGNGNHKLCFQEHVSCNSSNTAGRRLSNEERQAFEAKLGLRSFSKFGETHHHRSLQGQYGSGIIPV